METGNNKRELSSRLTPLYRWGLPAALTLVAISAVLWATITHSGQPEPVKVLVALLIAAISMLIARWLDRAKRVWVDNSHLFISDFRRETQIKLDRIAAVKASRILRPMRITIWFTQPTIFGSKIAFFPARGAQDVLLNLQNKAPLSQQHGRS